jgi:competence protein ComEC
MLLIDFINVGYGDAVLIREDPGGSAPFSMLVDCGDIDTGTYYEGSRRISALEFLRGEGVKRLDLLVLSHIHLDHVGGFLSLCRTLEIGELWVNCLPEKKLWDRAILRDETGGGGVHNMGLALNIYTQGLRLLEGANTRIRRIGPALVSGALTACLRFSCACAGEPLFRRQEELVTQILYSGAPAPLAACRTSNKCEPKTALRFSGRPENALRPQFCSSKLRRLEPCKPLRQWLGSKRNRLLAEFDRIINNTSLRLTLKYQSRTVILPGDVAAAYWLENPPERCDIVKIPHHGYLDSLSPDLLAILRPGYGIVSVSNDREDRPDKGILELLEAYTPNYYFTDAVALPGGFGPSARHSAVRVRIDRGTIEVTEV